MSYYGSAKVFLGLWNEGEEKGKEWRTVVWRKREEGERGEEGEKEEEEEDEEEEEKSGFLR